MIGDHAGHRATTSETEYLRRAIRIAVENGERGHLPFGAVVVRDGSVVGEGANSALADHDPSAHGEVMAIRAAARALGTLDLSGAIVYSSCEPCAICLSVAAAAGLQEIVYASPASAIPDLGYPGPADTGSGPRYQAAIRSVAPAALRQVEVPGADEPFVRFLARVGGR